ncbi:hypothetical protein ABBQ32_009432 [Trebouxia sp. C0010 RCD-2024]
MIRPLGVITFLAVISFGHAFKDQDFKKCEHSAFCTRLRGVQGQTCSISLSSISVKGASATASVLCGDTRQQYDLTLTGYDGIVRLYINEAGEPGKKRFQVPHALLPDLDKQATSWDKHDKSGNSLSLKIGQADITLQYSPLQLDVNVAGKPAIAFNSKQLFNFEHLRQKQEGDPEGWWQETFKSHTDSKPHGPEAISFDLSFPRVQHVYGLPEHATSFALKPTIGSNGSTSDPYRLYNLDVFEHAADSPFGLYGSIPLLLAHKQGLTVGAFWLNAAEMFVDVSREGDGTSTNWVAESGVLDLFLLLGPTPRQVSAQYARLTGSTALPQYFSIGYHQCRWNYRDQADVQAVNAGFDENDMPYDVIWLDIEHTDGKRYFTWDKHTFPDPVAMQDNLAASGRKLVTIVDPHIKRDTGYYIYKEAKDKGLYVLNKDKQEFDGWCWPGSSSYPDYLNPATRDWWAGQFMLNKYKGSTKDLYVWNDMNEFSVFNGPEITMHKDNLHHGDVEHRDLHNLNGALVHMATVQGLEERGRAIFGSDGDRPFVLSRSFFAGSQRSGPIWTGDNAATWEHLRLSVPMLLSISLAGLPFAGADVGGFFGNADSELLVRWNQLGTYYPFFRGHGHLETKRREPWLFGEDNTRRNRDSLRERYALLPYLYTLFWESHTQGTPIMRPLWYEFPEVAETYSLEEQFMFGPSMLVAPVMEQGSSSREVFLPDSQRWYDAHTGAEVKQTSGWLSSNNKTTHKANVNLEGIPVYLRGGHIVPRKERARRSTAQMHKDPFTLWIALDSSGSAQGDLYVDDGHSFAYQRGSYTHRIFSFEGDVLTNTAAESSAAVVTMKAGKLSVANTIERIVIVGLKGKPSDWKAVYRGAAGQHMDVETGPLKRTPGMPDVAFVIRKPDLPVDQDWSLQLVPRSQEL